MRRAPAFANDFDSFQMFLKLFNGFRVGEEPKKTHCGEVLPD